MMDERYIGNPDELWSEVTAFDHFLGEQPVILTYPSYAKQSTAPVILYEGIAINSNCKYKDAAFKFVKLLLSKDLQMANYKKSATNIIKGLSVNTAAYEEDVKYYTSDAVDGREMNGVSPTSNSHIIVNMTSIPIPKETIRQVNDIYSRIQPYSVIDEEIYRIVEEELQDFLEGRKTAEQTAKTIDDKATIYLNE
jgi:ABC-type glycerol-3-phosphate transport system substrate-binding protein